MSLCPSIQQQNVSLLAAPRSRPGQPTWATLRAACIGSIGPLSRTKETRRRCGRDHQEACRRRQFRRGTHGESNRRRNNQRNSCIDPWCRSHPDRCMRWLWAEGGGVGRKGGGRDQGTAQLEGGHSAQNASNIDSRHSASAPDTKSAKTDAAATIIR